MRNTAPCEIWTHDPWFTRPVLCHWAKGAALAGRARNPVSECSGRRAGPPPAAAAPSVSLHYTETLGSITHTHTHSTFTRGKSVSKLARPDWGALHWCCWEEGGGLCGRAWPGTARKVWRGGGSLSAVLACPSRPMLQLLLLYPAGRTDALCVSVRVCVCVRGFLTQPAASVARGWAGFSGASPS